MALCAVAFEWFPFAVLEWCDVVVWLVFVAFVAQQFEVAEKGCGLVVFVLLLFCVGFDLNRDHLSSSEGLIHSPFCH